MSANRCAALLCLVLLLSCGAVALADDFSATPLSGAAPLTVQFTSASANSPTSWSWSFGDGAASREQNPTHTYAGPGRYSAVLRVRPPEGTESVVKRDYVTVTKPGHWISVSATASRYLVNPGGPVTLSAAGKDSEGHTIASWRWSDGGKGGKFSNPAARTTTYKAPWKGGGAISLKVTATCAGGTSTTGAGAALVLVRAPRTYRPEQVVELARVGLAAPSDVAVNPVDGSCWVSTFKTKEAGAQVIHFAADGTELWRGAFQAPRRLDVNPADGSCWVSDSLPVPSSSPNHEVLVHLAADGSELWRGGDFLRDCPVGATSLRVNPADGSVWMTACGKQDNLLHMAQDGSDLPNLAWSGHFLAVNPSDGSYWVSDLSTNQLVHLSPTGSVLWQGGRFASPNHLAVNPADGSCYALDMSCCGQESGLHSKIVRVDRQGTELWRRVAFQYPLSVSVDVVDGSCWVADCLWDNTKGNVVHLDAAGRELWRGGNFLHPYEVAVNPTDGSCWVADAGTRDVKTGLYSGGALVHLGLRRHANSPLR